MQTIFYFISFIYEEVVSLVGYMERRCIWDVRRFKTMVDKQCMWSINVLWIDGCCEYIADDFLSYCNRDGIISEGIAPYTPQDNGKVDRSRVLMNMTRCILKEEICQNSYGDKLYPQPNIF